MAEINEGRKNNFIAPTIIALLIIATIGYYFWVQPSQNGSSNPPSFNIPKQTLKGQASSETICQIPGIYPLNTVNYQKPTGATDADSHPLLTGVHVYHSNVDVKVSDIINYVQPKDGNKILIAYYPSNANTTKKFSIFPEAVASYVSQNAMSTGTVIPANEGFVIFSCQNTKIYNILDEKTDGTKSLPANFSKNDTGTHWILFSGWGDTGPLVNLLKNYNLKALWIQKNDEFSFEQVTNIASLKFKEYHMIWAEVDATAAKSQKQICEENPACPTHQCIPYNQGGFVCTVDTSTYGNPAATATPQTACNQSCNNSCSPFASGLYACVKFPWTSGFFQGVSGVTGYTCGIGLSGGGCQLGLATGVSFPNYCLGSGNPDFNQQACQGQGGKPY